MKPRPPAGKVQLTSKMMKVMSVFFWLTNCRFDFIHFIPFISFRLLQDLGDVQILRHVFGMHVLGIDANGQLKIRFCTRALVVWGWVLGHLGRRCLKKALVSVSPVVLDSLNISQVLDRWKMG